MQIQRNQSRENGHTNRKTKSTKQKIFPQQGETKHREGEKENKQFFATKETLQIRNRKGKKIRGKKKEKEEEMNQNLEKVKRKTEIREERAKEIRKKKRTQKE